MNTSILFKNGELEVSKSLAEVMKESTGRSAIIPVANMNKGEISLKSLDCNFHFLKDCRAYARLLECAYFTGSIKAINSKITKLETKEHEEGLTADDTHELRNMKETIEAFKDVLSKCYTPAQKAFAEADKLIKFMSVYYTKDTSCFSNFNGFITFLNNLEQDKPNQVLKPLLEKVLQNFTIEKEDDIYLEYHFHENTSLVDDCRHRYYKGRKIKKGKVVKTHDEKGEAVKLEIVLAVIEDLQSKPRKKYEEEQKQAKAQAEAEAKKQAEAKAKAEAEKQAVEKAKQAEAKAKAEQDSTGTGADKGKKQAKAQN